MRLLHRRDVLRSEETRGFAVSPIVLYGSVCRRRLSVERRFTEAAAHKHHFCIKECANIGVQGVA